MGWQAARQHCPREHGARLGGREMDDGDVAGVRLAPISRAMLTNGKITDEWGVLEVTSGGVLLKRSENLITGVVVTAPLPDPRSSMHVGQGRTLQLKPGWKLIATEQKGSYADVRA